MIALVLLPLAILLACVVLGKIFGRRHRPLWWIVRIAVVPLIGSAIALYLYLLPTDLPPDYNPAIHGNPGRLDFFAMWFWGFLLPLFYLIVAMPFAVAFVIKGRKK